MAKKIKAKKETKVEPKLSAKDAVDLILELGRTGTPSHKIGLILKQEHSVHNIKELTGKRLTQILCENNAAPKLPADLSALIQTAGIIRKHRLVHKSDLSAKYGLLLTESKIRSLAKYYKSAKTLPPDWKYEAVGKEK